MVQQYISHYNKYGHPVRLSYDVLQVVVNQFNNNPTTLAKGVSINLTGNAESYAYQAVLNYKNLKIQFLIYPDKCWGLGDTILASTEKEYAYWTAWNLWFRFTEDKV